MANAHKRCIHVQITHETHADLKREARKINKSMTFIIEALCDAYVDGDSHLRQIVLDAKRVHEEDKIEMERGYISRDVLYDLIEADAEE